jgi:hypothetical protein
LQIDAEHDDTDEDKKMYCCSYVVINLDMEGRSWQQVGGTTAGMKRAGYTVAGESRGHFLGQRGVSYGEIDFITAASCCAHPDDRRWES